MRDSFRILFESKKDWDIYEESLDYVRKIIMGTDLVKEGLTSLCEGSCDKAKELLADIMVLDEKATQIAMNIKVNIVESIRDPYNREDLLKLTQSIREIMRAVKAVGHRLAMCEKVEIPEIMKGDLLEMVDLVVLTVKSLEMSLVGMPHNPEDAVKHAANISEHEEKVDNLRRDLMRDLILTGDDMTLTQFYIIRELIDNLERIADGCEETGYLIELIVMTSEQ